MTTPVNNKSNQLQAVLDSQAITQKERIDALSQKQLVAKKITEEIAADYPLTAQIITHAAEQCEFVTGCIGKIEGNQLEVGQSADQIEEQVQQFRVLVENSNPIDLMEAISEAMSKDLREKCQRLTKRCSELQAKRDQIDKATAQARQNRLKLLEEIEMLKKEHKDL